MFLLVLILLMSSGAYFLEAMSTGTCGFLDPSLALTTTCNGAVDYSFYLPSGVTSAKLNQIATAQLNQTSIAILPEACLRSLKNLVCSKIYLKCIPGLVATNTSTYNYDIYSDVSQFIPLPFQRPCKSVCKNVANQCLGLDPLLGFSQDCSSKTDYTFGAMPLLPKPFAYDQITSSTKCNTMTAAYRIQSTSEPYIHANDPAGACYGVVKNIYVPPAQLVSASLAPLQSSYVVQTAIETGLLANFKQLPVFLSKKCYTALKVYLCSSYMLAPAAQSFKDAFTKIGIQSTTLQNMGVNVSALFDYPFSLPSYPHQSICRDYQAACGAFIQMSGQASLSPNCAAVSSGVAKFPSASQVVATMTLPTGGALTFSTSPNNAQDSTTSSSTAYQTSCPQGYVVPNKDDSRTKWIDGTGCAVGCRSPMLSDSQWNINVLLLTVTAWLGLPAVLILIITWLIDKSKRQNQYLVSIFGIFSSLECFTIVIMSLMAFEDKYCASNAVPIDQSDGLNVCTAQAPILIISGTGTSASWAMMSIDLFLKVVLGYRSTTAFKPFYIAYSLLFPIPFTAYLLTKTYGFQGLLPICFPWNSYDNIAGIGDAYIVFTIPVATNVIIGLIAMFGVLYKILGSVRKSLSNTNASELPDIIKHLKILRTPVLFVLCFSTVVITYLVFGLVNYEHNSEVVQSFKDFTVCVFKNYDGTSSSWQSRCGNSPSKMYEFSFVCWNTFCIGGQALVLSFIYLSSSTVWTFWGEKTGANKVFSIAQNNFKSRASMASEAQGTQGASSKKGGSASAKKGSVTPILEDPDEKDEEDEGTVANNEAFQKRTSAAAAAQTNKAMTKATDDFTKIEDF